MSGQIGLASAAMFFAALACAVPSLASDGPEDVVHDPGTFYGGPKDIYLFAETPGRWSVDKARKWYAKQPWLVGVNFVPSTAVNDVEMWQAQSFDPTTMERELGWAHGLGFNTVRVFVNYAVWDADAEGLKRRFDQFLSISAKLGIRVMPVLLFGCDAKHSDAHVGPQPAPVPGVHNSRWVESLPPMVIKADGTEEWSPKAERYIKDMVGTFGRDERVVIWDLYNEPAQRKCIPFVEATFRWAREVDPVQPLASVWLAEPYSDLVNLHEYGPLDKPLTWRYEENGKAGKITFHAMGPTILNAEKAGRPVIVSEWMARDFDSKFETHLPFMKSRKVSCWSWGLVAGRTQTYLWWDGKPGSPPPTVWHHDILRKDGTPYSEYEASTIRYYTGIDKRFPAAPLGQSSTGAQ